MKYKKTFLDCQYFSDDSTNSTDSKSNRFDQKRLTNQFSRSYKIKISR